MLAITDHDTVAAHHFLRTRSNHDDLTLISGIELSTSWSSAEIHIVGLNFPLESPDLQNIVDQQGAARRKRSLHISERLSRRLPDWSAEAIFNAVLSLAMNNQKQGNDGFQLKEDDVQIGRPHFAQWLIETGFCKDMNEAFRKYLGNGKMGNLRTFWPPMGQAVAWIRAIGGTAVLAHPGKYDMTRTKLRALINDFNLAGGHALEVQGSNQPQSQREQLARFCLEFDLKASQGSDFHNPDYRWNDVGKLPASLPYDIEPVWADWL